MEYDKCMGWLKMRCATFWTKLLSIKQKCSKRPARHCSMKMDLVEDLF